MYNYFHSLLPPLSLAPFMPKTPLYSISLFFKGLSIYLKETWGNLCLLGSHTPAH
ncbi:DNA methylase [Porphyromonas gingivalis]|nr:DNA methylase [Porphyromonas gingivalis]